MRRLRNVLGGSAWLLLAAAASGQTTYWVHPSPGIGNDANPGTAAAPFLTIGAALLAPASSPLTIFLMPGDYSPTTNGETYPLSVTYPDVTFAGASVTGASQPCGAKLIHTTLAVPNAVFSVVAPADPNLRHVFKDFAIETTHRAIQYTAASDQFSLLEASNLEVSCWRGVVVTTTDLCGVEVVVDRCDLASVEECLRIDAEADNSGVIAHATNSSFTSAKPFPVVRLSAANDSSIDLQPIHTILRKGGTGVRSEALDGATISVTAYGCNFHDLGYVTLPSTPAGGGMQNPIDNGQIFRNVFNSIFNGNESARDIVGFSSSNDFIDHLMVEQPSLVGVGSSFLGAPDWVDADSGDYHLMPSSAAIDAGSNAFAGAISDFDGDPRTEPAGIGGASIVDVGADEFYSDYLYVFPRRPKIGTTSAVRLFGTPGMMFTWGLGVQDINGDVVDGQFGPALHLTNPLLDPSLFVTGTIGANGAAVSALTLPNTLGLVGQRLGEQALFFAPATLPAFSWGVNGWQHMIWR